MLTLSSRNQILIGAVLALLLIATRGQHFATLHSLPGGSQKIIAMIVSTAALTTTSGLAAADEVQARDAGD